MFITTRNCTRTLRAEFLYNKVSKNIATSKLAIFKAEPKHRLNVPNYTPADVLMLKIIK